MLRTRLGRDSNPVEGRTNWGRGLFSLGSRNSSFLVTNGHTNKSHVLLPPQFQTSSPAPHFHGCSRSGPTLTACTWATPNTYLYPFISFLKTDHKINNLSLNVPPTIQPSFAPATRSRSSKFHNDRQATEDLALACDLIPLSKHQYTRAKYCFCTFFRITSVEAFDSFQPERFVDECGLEQRVFGGGNSVIFRSINNPRIRSQISRACPGVQKVKCHITQR